MGRLLRPAAPTPGLALRVSLGHPGAGAPNRSCLGSWSGCPVQHQVRDAQSAGLAPQARPLMSLRDSGCHPPVPPSCPQGESPPPAPATTCPPHHLILSGSNINASNSILGMGHYQTKKYTQRPPEKIFFLNECNGLSVSRAVAAPNPALSPASLQRGPQKPAPQAPTQ